MSLANDLLNTLSVDEDDKTLVIDHYTRSITIPKSITTLGVENDDEVLRLDFRMPRYLGTVDLSKFSIRVNYINANGDDGFYKVTDSRVVGENVLFSWLVGPTATAYKGDTRFNVNMVVTDAQSAVLNEYNTAVAKLPVLEGMAVGTDAITHYIDILEQWESRLFGISGTEEAKLIAVSEEEQKNIAQHAGIVAASIPSDYTTTSKLADKAERTKADAIICSAEGEVVKVEDSSDDKLRGLNIFGKTAQITTTGANLAYVKINVSNYPYNGVVSSKTEDGNVLIHGTATDNLWNRLVSADLVAGETYTLSANKATSLGIWDVTANGLFISKTAGSEAVTFVAPNTGNYSVCIDNASGSQFSYILANIMLNSGSVALPWEPYSGGVASPSPQWSQGLKPISDTLIGLYGKNLIDIDAMELGSNKSITISPDKYTITAVGGSDKTYAYSHYDMPYDLVRLLRGKTLRLESDSVTKSLSNAYSPVQMNIKCSDGTFQYPVNHNTRLQHEFFVPEDTEEIRFGIYTNNSANLLETDNTVVVKGVRLTLSHQSGYEPYAGYQTVSLAGQDLHGIPVTSGGNYTDSNGQQWVGDEIDFERGVYVQRFKKVAFTGQENWTQDTNYTCAYRVGAGHIAIGGLCTHYPTYFITEDIGVVSGVYMAYTVNHIITDTRFVNDLNGFTAFLAGEYEAGHPVTVLRRLNEPVEIPLTASEIAEFKKLHSNYPNTTVFNDVGANMRVSYNADTKTWIENLIDSKIAAAVANLQ